MSKTIVDMGKNIPSISFANDCDTGFYEGPEGDIGIVFHGKLINPERVVEDKVWAHFLYFRVLDDKVTWEDKKTAVEELYVAVLKYGLKIYG